MKKLNTRQIALNGVVAGLYAAITILTASFAYGDIQFRIADALCLLVALEPSLTVGLTLGCVIANIFSTVSVLDIVVGSAATLIAAMLTARCRSRMLSPLAPVLVNAVVVGAVLYFVYYSGSAVPMWLPMAQVGLGQFVACYGLGLPLLGFLEKRFPSWREREGEQEGCALKGEGKA